MAQMLRFRAARLGGALWCSVKRWRRSINLGEKINPHALSPPAASS
jgi:hypothetical protein